MDKIFDLADLRTVINLVVLVVLSYTSLRFNHFKKWIERVEESFTSLSTKFDKFKDGATTSKLEAEKGISHIRERVGILEAKIDD